MNNSAILALAESIEKKQPAVLVTVIEMKGASPAKVGAQLTYLSDGSTTGTIGGGRLEAAILSEIIAVRCGHEDLKSIQFRRLQSEKSGIA